MEKAHAASAGPRSTMNPVVLEGPNPRPENEGGLLGRKISAQMRKANAAMAMQAATIKTRRFGLLSLCCSEFPMISLVSMIPSIGEKPAVAVVGWVSGYAFCLALGRWWWNLVPVSMDRFLPMLVLRATSWPRASLRLWLLSNSELLAVRLVGKTSWLF